MPGGARIPTTDAISLRIKIRQNQWTRKYRSLTHTYFTRSIFALHWSIIPSTTFLLLVNLPWSSGRLPEMSPKISSKTYHFLPKFQNLPHLNWEFSYIFYTFLNPPPPPNPRNERKISLMFFWNLPHVWFLHQKGFKIPGKIAAR